ncbi:MAG: class I SAM-dependent methyltransferase [Bryobacteraceae bacterium]|nr:class I SAM-dependent methyltransferase [Bryobacteraceae bacterium]MCX7603684.1 class I SAM-dependent methyltransferase [Bryobacteraceae bacterium]
MKTEPLPRSATGPAGGGPAAGRRSYALEQVSEYLGSFTGGQVVDLGGACQSTIEYVTGLGHRLYAEDVLHTLGQGAEDGRLPADCLDFPPSSVDVTLCWDRFQFLTEAAAVALQERIHRVMAPGGLLLALFHPEQTASVSPLSCRVADARHLLLASAGPPRPLRPFTTRMIERFFQRYDSLKFYLTRENLQEVIVRR